MNFRTVFTNETVDKIKIFFLHVDLIEQERRIDLDHLLVLVRLHGINLFKIRIGGIVVHVVKSGTDQPDIAGQGIANPLATILSAAMMLRFSLAFLMVIV